MNDRLRERIKQLEDRDGKIKARTQICRDIDKSERTLLAWLQKGVPSANDAVSLALACEFNEGEAWEIARECFPVVAKETA